MRNTSSIRPARMRRAALRRARAISGSSATSRSPLPNAASSSARVRDRAAVRRCASAIASPTRSSVSKLIVVPPAHNGFRDVALVAVQWIGYADLCSGGRETSSQAIGNAHLAGVGGDQMNGMNGPALTDAIDAADALLEPHRIPRQLEIDDKAAVLVKVEALGGGIGREQYRVARGR